MKRASTAGDEATGTSMSSGAHSSDVPTPVARTTIPEATNPPFAVATPVRTPPLRTSLVAVTPSRTSAPAACAA